MYHSWLACVLVFILAMFSVVGGVFAEMSPLSANTPAEEWVLRKVGSGEVNLTGQFKKQEDRVIRAAFLVSLLTEPHRDMKLDRHGVRIVGAVVIGNLDLASAEVSFDTELIECRFMGEVDLSRTVFRKGLSFEKSIFHATANLRETKIAGDFRANGAEFRNKEVTDFLSMKVGSHALLDDAKFSGPVSFYSAQITGNFESSGAEFRNQNERVDFGRMKVGGLTLLDKAKFSGPVTFVSAQVTGNFQANGAEFSGGVDFSSAQITGLFHVPDAQFKNEKEGAIFESMKVGSNTILMRTQFSGPVSFNSAQIAGPFQLSRAEFRNKAKGADFVSMKVGSHAFLGRTQFSGPVTFDSAQIASHFLVPGAEFHNEKEKAEFESMKVGGNAVIEFTQFSGPVTFDSAQVAGNFQASFANFRNREKGASFTSMKVGGHAVLSFTQFSGPVTFYSAQIASHFRADGVQFKNEKETAIFQGMKADGSASFIGAMFRGSADMSDSRFLDLTIGDPRRELKENLPHYPKLDLSRTVIARELRIGNVELGELIATGLQVSGPVLFTNLIVTDRLNLEQSTYAMVSFSNVTPPKEKKDVLLAGMKYRDIRAENEPNSWKRILELINGAEYDANTYDTLESFFRGQGYSDRADEVFFAHKHRLREEFSGWFNWAWSWFMNVFVRYGHRPQFAFGWSGLVVAFGCFVFRKKGMEPRKPDSMISHYHNFWYSLDVFVPV